MEHTVLLVEDDDTKFRIVQSQLMRIPVGVRRAWNLNDARHLLSKHTFGLIILDGEVPGPLHETLDFLKELLRENPGQIVVAGSGSKQSNLQLIAAGCQEDIESTGRVQQQIKRLLNLP